MTIDLRLLLFSWADFPTTEASKRSKQERLRKITPVNVCPVSGQVRRKDLPGFRSRSWSDTKDNHGGLAEPHPYFDQANPSPVYRSGAIPLVILDAVACPPGWQRR
jgi:hypothetical protein